MSHPPRRMDGGPELAWRRLSHTPAPHGSRAAPAPLSRSAELPNLRTSVLLSPHGVRAPGAGRGLCLWASFDLLFFFISFPFLEPKYPPQATELCSAKGFYGRLQMTRGKAQSWLIFKSRTLGDPLSIHPSISSHTRANTFAEVVTRLDPRWSWGAELAGPGPCPS